MELTGVANFGRNGRGWNTCRLHPLDQLRSIVMDIPDSALTHWTKEVRNLRHPAELSFIEPAGWDLKHHSTTWTIKRTRPPCFTVVIVRETAEKLSGSPCFNVAGTIT
jgi:hypothetical protein